MVQISFSFQNISFPDEYCCPLYIDPVDPLFTKIGQMFLRRIIDVYGGSNHIYFSDPFNELQPRLSDATYLANASKGIYETMATVDPDAVWLLQGWMFVKNPFWSDPLLRAFVTAVPHGRMLVLDLQSENSPQYKRCVTRFLNYHKKFSTLIHYTARSRITDNRLYGVCCTTLVERWECMDPSRS